MNKFILACNFLMCFYVHKSFSQEISSKSHLSKDSIVFFEHISHKRYFPKDSIIFLDIENLRRAGIFESAKNWKCKKKHISLAYTFILEEINKFNYSNIHLHKINLAEYYRQFLCYKDENNNKIIHVYAFCSYTVFDNIFKYPINGLDGGTCYWEVKINISKKKVIYFLVHDRV